MKIMIWSARRFAFLFLLCVVLSSCQQDEEVVVDTDQNIITGTIVAVGDSLTAGLGLSQQDAYPALLQEKLQASGYNFEVINAGVSGETSSGTSARIDWILTLDPDIVILETGANDGLRGIDPKIADQNIRQILSLLEGNGVVVVLAGMKMGWNMGPVYTSKFNKIYPEIAADFDCVFMPFFLEDVVMKRKLNQADGIHPTHAGYQLIVENLFPYVVEGINRLRTE